jgi:hypothetical protein
VDTKEAVDATPAAVSALRQVLPEIIWAMSAFQPAATGIQGDGRSSMWQS